MSFWKQSPGPHWSHVIESLFQTKPYVLRKELPLQPNFTYDLVTSEHCDEIATLLKTQYQTYSGSRICLTGEQIAEHLKDGWIGIRIHDFGTVFSRPLGKLAFGQNIMKEDAGLVDFFCVHITRRQTGIGSRLLTALFYETSKVGRHVHLFQKEGYPLVGLPHLWASSYCWRKRMQYVDMSIQKSLVNHIVTKVDSSHLPIGSACWNSSLAINHTDIYECDGIYVGITDTFHRSVPDGNTIGEVSWVSGKEKNKMTAALEAIVDTCKYDVLLMDSTLPHIEEQWSKDARYAYYIFNAQPLRFFDVKPSLTF